METKRENEIVDIWMTNWQGGYLGSDYTNAREFRDFWIIECPSRDISMAYNLYEKSKNNKKQ